MAASDDPTASERICPACGSAFSEPECPRCFETRTRDDSSGSRGYTGPREIGGYRILRELGAGGMGSVFEAFDERMNRRVALKVLARHVAQSEKAGKRFEQEAWIAGRLDHPNLVKVYDRGSWEELAYFSMELVDGGSLHDVIHNMRRWGRDDGVGLTFGTADYITWAIRQVIDAARALDYAHRHGVVHRDIKPMNLLLSREPRAIKIADFGLAFEVDATRMTTEGKMMGTLVYMAPEQILGKRDRIGPRTDVYALGVTLFELLTLEYPFVGKTQELYINNVLTVEARRPRKLNRRVSNDLETVIRKALEKEPADRYATAAALAEDLENIVNLRPIVATPPSWLTRSLKWVRRKPVHAALVASILIGLPIAGTLGYTAFERRLELRRARIQALLREERWLLERDRLDDALERAAQVLDLDPDNVRALRDRATLLLKKYDVSGEPPESERARQWERRSIEAIDHVIAVRPDIAWPHATKAYLLENWGRTVDAGREKRLAEALRSTPLADEELLYDAELAYDSGRYQASLDRFTELYRRHPDWSHAVVGRGQAYEALGRPEQALVEYRLALSINPELQYTMMDMARLETERGNLTEGEQWIRKAIDGNPDTAIAHEVLSYNLAEQGFRAMAEGSAERAMALFREAERAARRSLALNPDQTFALVNLGASLIEQYRLAADPDENLAAEAVRHLRTVVDRLRSVPGPENEAALRKAQNNLCDLLIQLGQLTRALDACFDVTARSPDYAVGFYNLAGVYALLGRKEDALAGLERDLALGDTDWRYLAEDAWFESLRDDPRFQNLLRRMRESAGE